MTLVVFLILLLPVSYLFFMVMLKVGWNSARQIIALPTSQTQRISVVIAVRNEERTIGRLLDQLKSLTYSSFEVVVVDDHSSDRTASIVEHWVNVDPRFRLIKNEGAGKKQAIATGVRKANGSVIVTTDGDCEIQQSWLTQINHYFQHAHTKMVFGGVSIHGKTYFGHLQAIEFSSLIGSGISLWALGKPVMCNGANLAFRKEVFNEVDGYSGNEHIASGDDEFLMRKILAQYPSGVMFLNDSQGNVQTESSKDVKTFAQQRLRWAGKWRHNQSLMSKVTAVYVLLIQLALIAAFFILLIFPNPITAIIIGCVLLLRLVAEAWFLIPVSRFLKVKWRWDVFLLLQFIYPFYVVGIGLFSNLTAVTWKDRRI